MGFQKNIRIYIHKNRKLLAYYKKIASEVRRVIDLIKEIRDSLGISESF
ncbi:hypothetical protein ES705_00616 [subsurface metagenome]|nr:hypothetical protein [Clostridia bacterium]